MSAARGTRRCANGHEVGTATLARSEAALAKGCAAAARAISRLEWHLAFGPASPSVMDKAIIVLRRLGRVEAVRVGRPAWYRPAGSDFRVPGRHEAAALTRSQPRPAMPRAGATGKRTWRRCLACRKEFPSEGAHNQVCIDCKSTAAWRTGGDPNCPW